MSWIEYTSYKNFPNNLDFNYDCGINRQIRNNDRIKTSWGYREYMQRNANTIIDYNTKNALTNSNRNVLNIVNRGYSNIQSDMKKQYLSKQKIVLCPSIPMF